MPTPVKPEEKYCATVGEMSVVLGRSEQYVTDMKKGGFKLPATRSEAIEWIRQNGPVTRFRSVAKDSEAE